MINFTCSCGKKYAVADSLAGRTANCKGCGQKVKIPISMSIDISAPLASNPVPNARYPFGKGLLLLAFVAGIGIGALGMRLANPGSVTPLLPFAHLAPLTKPSTPAPPPRPYIQLSIPPESKPIYSKEDLHVNGTVYCVSLEEDLYSEQATVWLLITPLDFLDKTPRSYALDIRRGGPGVITFDAVFKTSELPSKTKHFRIEASYNNTMSRTGVYSSKIFTVPGGEPVNR